MKLPMLKLPAIPRIEIPGLAPKKPVADPVADAPKVLNELQSAFSARRQEEADRFADATDSEYWFAVCFRSREHKEAFLEALDLLDIGDKYLDGHEVAKRLKVKLGEVKEFKKSKRNRRLEDLT